MNTMEGIDLVLLKVFKCACSKYLHPPIYQCERGHSLCNKCITEHKCSNCKVTLDKQARNYSLEEIYRHMLFPCIYGTEGCELIAKGPDIKDHEKKCFFRSIKCPLFSRCKFNTSANKLFTHFESKHSTSTTTSREWNCPIPSKDSRYSAHIFGVYDGYFIFYCKVAKESLRIATFYEGPSEASVYNYQLVFGDKLAITTKCSIFFSTIEDESLMDIPFNMYQDSMNECREVLPMRIDILAETGKLFKNKTKD